MKKSSSLLFFQVNKKSFSCSTTVWLIIVYLIAKIQCWTQGWFLSVLWIFFFLLYFIIFRESHIFTLQFNFVLLVRSIVFCNRSVCAKVCVVWDGLGEQDQGVFGTLGDVGSSAASVLRSWGAPDGFLKKLMRMWMWWFCWISHCKLQ